MLGQGLGMVNPQQDHARYMESTLRQYQGMIGMQQAVNPAEVEKKKSKKLLLLRRK
jgi:hypothetical protein